MKLRGQAKAAFLARMAKGRRAAGGRKAQERRKKGARKARRNPELLTIANPAPAAMAKAVAAYKRFHGVAPKKTLRMGKGSEVWISLGELRELVYQPKRGARRGPAWFHQFGAGAVLATSPDGRKLAVIDRKRRKVVDFDRGLVT